MKRSIMTHKILIVDDNRIIRTSIAEYLGVFGFSTDTADDAKAAVSMMQRVRYDFVIMEINLPTYTGGYSGEFLLNQIRYRYPWVKTIVITGDMSIETGLESIRLGASYWLTKPFSLEVLKNRISILASLGNVRSFTKKQRKELPI